MHPNEDGPNNARALVDSQGILQLLSIVGPLPVALLEALGGPAVIEELERGGAIHLVGRTTIAIAPGQDPVPVVGELRRRSLLAALAEAAEHHPIGALTHDHAVALGLAVIEAGGRARVPVIHALRGSLALGLIDQAIEMARYAIDAFPGDLDVAHLASMAFEAAGRHASAASIIPPSQPDAAWVGRWWQNRFVSLRTTIGIEDLPPADDTHRELLAAQAWVEILAGKVEAVVASTGKVFNSPSASPQAIVWAGVVAATAGALDAQEAVVDRLIAVTNEAVELHGDRLTPFARLQLDIAQYLSDVFLGRLQRALQFATDNAQAESSPFLQAAWTALSGLALRELGRWDEALNALRASLSTFPDDNFGLITWARDEVRVCEAMTGEAAALETPPEPFGLYRSLLSRNMAWKLAAGGNMVDAAKASRHAVQIAVDLGQPGNAALSILDLARFGQTREATELLPVLNDRHAPVVTMSVQAVLAFAEPDLAQSMRAFHQASLAGIEPLASELAMRARGLAYRLGPTVGACVELWTDARLAPTPYLREHPPIPVHLTAREREIALLAVDGVKSRAIADQLGVTTRTVDNMLGRVYQKCGVGNRQELAATRNRWW